MDNAILSWVVFLPLAGVPLLAFINRESKWALKLTALAVSTITFLVSLFLFFRFDPQNPGFQFSIDVPWIPSFGIHYHLGLDGISLFLVLLTTFLTPIAIWSSWTAITEKLKGYLISILILESAMSGVFLALDLFLFFVFWEAILIPMYFLIGIWGGPRRIYATIKFVLFTMTGSLLMFVAIIVLFFLYHSHTGQYSFNLLDYYKLPIPLGAQTWLFLAFALAFAIKVPMFPFHTWLPNAHVEAPTAGSVILAGILLKMGTYGFLRFCWPLFPNAFEQFLPMMIVLSLIGIIYGAWMSMVQKDIKSLIAYSSVSHLGFVMLGLAVLNLQGLQGSLLQMLNHGISTGALFLIVGMIYERRHTRLIADYGGITKVVPVFATFFLIVALSSIGLPGTNGFVGEFLILLGAFKFNWIYAALGATGVIFAAVYMLWMYQRVMFGPVTNPANSALTDLNRRERWTLIPLVVLIFWIGLYPKPFLSRMEGSLANLVTQVEERRGYLSQYRNGEIVSPVPQGLLTSTPQHPDTSTLNQASRP